VPTAQTVPPEARDAILAWYAANGRRLTFRETNDPYAILVSEVIAQQTQAARAAEYWQRFLARFPTVAVLAAASPADVQRAWQGLGYNRRALAIWRASRAIEAEHGGKVPDSVEDLEALPGVGRYTARAVAAIAFGRRVGRVSRDVRTVLRIRGVGSPPATDTSGRSQSKSTGHVEPIHPSRRRRAGSAGASSIDCGQRRATAG
jgi:A/G-specific adenine glycosylase